MNRLITAESSRCPRSGPRLSTPSDCTPWTACFARWSRPLRRLSLSSGRHPTAGSRWTILFRSAKGAGRPTDEKVNCLISVLVFEPANLLPSRIKLYPTPRAEQSGLSIKVTECTCHSVVLLPLLPPALNCSPGPDNFRIPSLRQCFRHSRSPSSHWWTRSAQTGFSLAWSNTLIILSRQK